MFIIINVCILKSICIEFNPGIYVVNYGFIYALCGGSLFALSSTPEFMWSIMASFMLYVVDKYAWDVYMENTNF